MSEYMFEYFLSHFLSCETLKSLISVRKKMNLQTLKEIFKMTKCIYIIQESEGGGHVLREIKSTTYLGSLIGISQPLYYFRIFVNDSPYIFPCRTLHSYILHNSNEIQKTVSYSTQFSNNHKCRFKIKVIFDLVPTGQSKLVY